MERAKHEASFPSPKNCCKDTFRCSWSSFTTLKSLSQQPHYKCCCCTVAKNLTLILENNTEVGKSHFIVESVFDYVISHYKE